MNIEALADRVFGAVRDWCEREFDKRLAALPPGEPGRDGVNGQDGRDGRDGQEGAPGRDALQIEAIVIDETRSYRRGTWARHAGGLVRAFRTTDPLTDPAALERCGWEVMVCGLAGIEVSEVGEREIKTVFRMTDGMACEYVRRDKGLIPRGPWREKGAYEMGDVVTYDNSSWVCMRETSARPMATKPQDDVPPDWRLLAKKGTDGNKPMPTELKPRTPLQVGVPS